MTHTLEEQQSSRQESPRRRPAILAVDDEPAVLAAILEHKLRPKAIAVAREYDRGLPQLMVHGSELNQVWTNLLDNAIDAVGEGGQITISTRRDGPCALADISDDGPGIPTEIRERVFDSFYTTKDVEQGSGLGLATARRIVVDRHGGSLSVDSEPGLTTFLVWLPLPEH